MKKFASLNNLALGRIFLLCFTGTFEPLSSFTDQSIPNLKKKKKPFRSIDYHSKKV